MTFAAWWEMTKKRQKLFLICGPLMILGSLVKAAAGGTPFLSSLLTWLGLVSLGLGLYLKWGLNRVEEKPAMTSVKNVMNWKIIGVAVGAAVVIITAGAYGISGAPAQVSNARPANDDAPPPGGGVKPDDYSDTPAAVPAAQFDIHNKDYYAGADNAHSAPVTKACVVDAQGRLNQWWYLGLDAEAGTLGPHTGELINRIAGIDFDSALPDAERANKFHEQVRLTEETIASIPALLTRAPPAPAALIDGKAPPIVGGVLPKLSAPELVRIQNCAQAYLGWLHFIEVPALSYGEAKRADDAVKLAAKNEEAATHKTALEAFRDKLDAALPPCDDRGVLDTVKSGIAASPAGVQLGLRVLEVRNPAPDTWLRSPSGMLLEDLAGTALNVPLTAHDVLEGGRACHGVAMTTAGRKNISYKLTAGEKEGEYWVETKFN